MLTGYPRSLVYGSRGALGAATPTSTELSSGGVGMLGKGNPAHPFLVLIAVLVAIRVLYEMAD